MVGPSVGVLGLEADIDNFIMSSETDDDRSLWSMSESSEIDILLEKWKIKFSFLKKKTFFKFLFR